MSVTQPRRLTYTRRDLLSYHADVSRYISEFITRIKDTSEANTGRLYLSLIEALVDNSNYSTDQAFLALILSTAKQRKNILRIAAMLDYYPSSVSPSSVDATFSMLTGVAPGGGQAIPIYTRTQSSGTPTVEFLTVEAGTIPEGLVSVDIPVIQGILVVDESLTTSSSGDPDQEYTLQNAKTPHNRIEVKVDGKLWTRVNNFGESDDESEHFVLEFDEDDYTTVKFGDGEFGKSPSSGDAITATYIKTEAEEGNVSKDSVNRIIGSLASTVGVNNTLASSGGAESETNESIKRNAPLNHSAHNRIVNKPDHEAVANAVSGVYKSFAVSSEGARTDVYLLPDGGGVASSYLIGLVQAEFDELSMEGAIPVAASLQPAGIQVSVNVVTFDSKTQKSSVKSKVIAATNANLVYTELIRGRAFTRSDLSSIYENIDSGNLIDYVDFSVLTRVPRVVQSNSSAPEVVGRVLVYDGVGYSEVLVTAISTTQFSVSVDGVPQSTQGTVATEFETDDGCIKFTLGVTGETFVVGDTWRFKTSKYNDNIVIDSDEFMELEESSDLTVSVFYPGEYDIKTKAAV